MAMVVLAFPLTLVVPRGSTGLALGVLITFTAVMVLVIEIRRVLVFRRDLRQQRASRDE